MTTYTVAPFKYQVHRFTSNGTFTPPAGVTLNANYLVVGGGGGSVGGRPGVMYGCGGGGGQLLEGSTTISSSQTVTIGSGGTAGGVYGNSTGTIILGPDGITQVPTFVQGGAGTPSSLGTITAVAGAGAVSNGPSSCRGGASTLANGTVVAGRLSSGISGAGGSGSNGVGPAPIRNGAYGAGSAISTGALISYGGGGSSCDGVGNGTTTGSATAAGQNGAANRGSGGGAGSVPTSGNCNGNTPQATPGKLGGSGFVAVRYKLFTITYDGNTNTGGTTPPQVVDVADGESFTTAPATAFTKANAVFTGWNTAADGSGTTVAANASWGPSGQPASAVTLYAQWRPVEYNVHFDPNGAGTTGTMADQHFIYANGNTLRPNAFARTGYTFQGWNSQDDGNGVDYADGAVGDTLTNVDGSTVTLYAKWSINHYSVSFNANGGTGTMPDQPFTVNTPQALAANTFTRPGYPFAGWNTKADGTGTSYTDQQVVNNLSTTDGAVVPLFAMWSGLSLVKSASPSDAESYNPGQPITYSFVVTNTETTTITGVTVSEEDFDGSGPMSPIQCPAGAASLAPGAQVTCTATYVVTQDDVDSGAITNSATAHGSAPDGAAVTSEQADVTIPGNQQPAVGLTKSVASPSGPVSQVGDVITYRFRVTNLGNVTLKDAQIDDQQDLPAGPLTSGPTCPTQNFLPGQYVDCTATYTVTQADLDHGSITNTATASATGPLPLGAVVTSAPSSVTVPVDQVRALSLVKTASPSDAASYVVNQAIRYTFDATNTGNTTLTGVTIAEDEFTGDGPLTALTCLPGPAPVSLAPGAHLTCTADYVITQEDIDRGTTLNRATAHATGPVVVDSAQAEVELSGNPVRSLGLVKRAADVDDVNGDQQVNVDDTIAYEFDLTNTGTVTLTLPEVSDPLAGSVTCPPVSLGPTQTTTCTADDLYVITQADLDLGHVDNTATGTALDPSMATVTSAPASLRTLLDKDPGLALDKQVAEVKDVNGNGRTDIGDTIEYQFVLTNVRTVTLTNLTVSDPTLGAVTCPGGNLSPRQAVTCQSTSVHTVTEADIEAGHVTNFASAAATTLTNDPVAANDDTTTTPIDQVTSVTLDKNVAKVTDANRNQVTDVGDEIRWVFVVTNTGTTRVTGITISDPMLAGAAITIPCPATNLPSGGSMTCEADGGYPISAADAAAGAVVNAATVMADGLASQPVAGRSDATRTAVSATPQTPPTELPSTGGPPRALPWFGALLTLAGAVLVMIHRRRRA